MNSVFGNPGIVASLVIVVIVFFLTITIRIKYNLHPLKVNLLFIQLEHLSYFTFSVIVFYFSPGIFDARAHPFQFREGQM